MSKSDRGSVILVVYNLFFSTKLSANLRRIGYSVEAGKTLEDVKAKSSAATAAVILDLSVPDVMGMIKRLKDSPETAHIPLIGFGGHKGTELFRTAREQGCDLVVTNSAIASDLEGLLTQASEIGRKNG